MITSSQSSQYMEQSTRSRLTPELEKDFLARIKSHHLPPCPKHSLLDEESAQVCLLRTCPKFLELCCSECLRLDHAVPVHTTRSSINFKLFLARLLEMSSVRRRQREESGRVFVPYIDQHRRLFAEIAQVAQQIADEARAMFARTEQFIQSAVAASGVQSEAEQETNIHSLIEGVLTNFDRQQLQSTLHKLKDVIEVREGGGQQIEFSNNGNTTTVTTTEVVVTNENNGILPPELVEHQQKTVKILDTHGRKNEGLLARLRALLGELRTHEFENVQVVTTVHRPQQMEVVKTVQTVETIPMVQTTQTVQNFQAVHTQHVSAGVAPVHQSVVLPNQATTVVTQVQQQQQQQQGVVLQQGAVQQGAVLAGRELHFSSVRKAPTIVIDRRTVAHQTKHEEFQRFALMEPQLSTQRRCHWALRVKELKEWIGLGVCHPSIITAQNYEFDVNSLGHGYYMVSHNGFTWSHDNAAEQCKQKSFTFASGDIIHIEFDPIARKVRFSKGSHRNQVIEVSLSAGQDDFAGCVNLGGAGDCVEIIETDY